MTSSPNLDPEFVVAEGITLSASDLRYGLNRSLIDAQAVIDIALAEVVAGEDDSLLTDLGYLLKDESRKVAGILAALDDPMLIHDPRESARKWLYLSLKWVFLQRGKIDDPLGVVEELYADFDYPPSITNIVRYMPVASTDLVGKEALMRRWEDFLHRERASLASR